MADTHRAENCPARDACQRLTCRIWREAWAEGYEQGLRDGFQGGYEAGFEAGAASARET